MRITRRATILAPTLLAAPALAQADQRPTLTIAVQRLSNSNTFEPPREQSNVGFRLHGLYAEQLIGTDWLNNAALVPGLATEWRRVDARTLDLRLRPGVRFHDGSELTAEDVVFSFREGCSARRARRAPAGRPCSPGRRARSHRRRWWPSAAAPIRGWTGSRC